MSVQDRTASHVNGSASAGPDSALGTQHSALTRIYPTVHLAEGCELEDFVIIGKPPKGAAPGELPPAR